jgi:glucokinase
MRSSSLLAVDIGGTKLAVGTADRAAFLATGKLQTIVKEPIPGSGAPDVVMARLLAIAREMLGSAAPGSIGISIGGPLDHRTGTVINFPHLPEWKNIRLVEWIGSELSAPAVLDNDANLGALAEHRWGAGRGASDMVYITVSTGIGGGVIVDGRLLHGVRSGAGEIGHITVQTEGPLCPCGNRGCLERMASGTHIAGRAREALAARPGHGAILRELAGGDLSAVTAALVARAARAGDPLATEIWESSAEYLAIGIGSIIHVLAPEVVVLGGGVVQAGDQLLEPVRRRLAAHVHYIPLDRIRIVAAELGHDSALLGAMTLAAESWRG